MIKQIPTYGAAILTAMVIVRAVTLEEEGDISNLYQRNQDTEYIAQNTELRAENLSLLNQPTVLLASTLKTPNATLQPVAHTYTPVCLLYTSPSPRDA